MHKHTIIGASLSESHTNRYYEKIAIVVCVCVCVRDTLTTCFACRRTRIKYILYNLYTLRRPRVLEMGRSKQRKKVAARLADE